MSKHGFSKERKKKMSYTKNGMKKILDFSTKFPTYIIAFCPDTASWFVTNQRQFFFEYEKQFQTEEEGIDFFKKNAKLFFDLEKKMGFPRPDLQGVFLENTKENVLIGK